MSKIALSARPIVLFDVTNPDHRLWTAEYLKTNTWGHCPVQFAIGSNRNLTQEIFTQMVTYYTTQEFCQVKA